MGHFIFMLLHLAAILFGFIWLVITIPLHLIYGSMRRAEKARRFEAAMRSYEEEQREKSEA
jgi:hypothetical protein